MSLKVAVIGSGPGGLASAMLLSSRGLNVDVYEAAPQVGGRSKTWEQDGFRFDLGPTFFLYPRVLEELFEACGRSLRDEVELTQISPQYRLDFEGRGRIDATPDIDDMERQIAKIAPGQESGFARFLDDNRRKLERARPILERAFPGITSLFAADVLRAIPHLRPWSVDSELKKYFSDPLVRIAFSFQSKYLGMSPYQCPSLFTILAFLEYEYGVHHPMGGIGRVSEAMQNVAEQQGAKFHFSTPVTGLEFDGRKVTAVNTEQGRHEYDAVVINGDFARVVPKLIPDHLRKRWNDRKVEKARYSCSTFMLYLGVEGLEEQLPHHTIYIPETYTEALEAIEPRHELHENPPFYIQNACITDPGQAPAGHSTLYVLVPVTNQVGQINWDAEGPRYRELILDRLEAFGIRDLRSRIRTERMITPADWESKYEVHQGAVFNLAHSMDQMLHKRPGNRFEGLDGVYLAGGGTHPGSGLPVIYESARISTNLLFEDLGVPGDHSTADKQNNDVKQGDETLKMGSDHAAA
ncbi:MAG: phytoene desaturase [Rickettsiales bacterium]|nr:phytoene desaturase [Rickettsiales bacterium]|tara:strand:- start:4313 stop:5881 length:1569 start_codon:yes stop_codon:yes gene_type:complete